MQQHIILKYWDHTGAHKAMNYPALVFLTNVIKLRKLILNTRWTGAPIVTGIVVKAWDQVAQDNEPPSAGAPCYSNRVLYSNTFILEDTTAMHAFLVSIGKQISL